MLRLNLGRRPRPLSHTGDIFDGYYYPVSLFGRSRAYGKDIQYLFAEFLRDLQRLETPLNLPGVFAVFATTFRRCKFSYVYAIAELEDPVETFHLLSGVLLRHLRLGFQVVFSAPMQQRIRQCVKNLLSPCFADYEEQEERLLSLVYRCYLIFLFYALSASQYTKNGSAFRSPVPTESAKGLSTTAATAQIPSVAPTQIPFHISLKSLQMLRLTTAEAQQDHIFLEIPTLVRRLVFCNDPTSVRICYCDGPQYIYQDRYGSPLSPFGLESEASAAYDKGPTLTSPSYEGLFTAVQNVQQSVATLETLLNTPPSTLPLNGAAANESAVDANNSAVAPQSLPVSHLPDAMRQLMSYGHHLMALASQLHEDITAKCDAGAPSSQNIQGEGPRLPTNSLPDTVIQPAAQPAVHPALRCAARRRKKRKHFPLRSTRRNPTGVGAVGAVDDVPTEASQRCMRQDVFPTTLEELLENGPAEPPNPIAMNSDWALEQLLLDNTADDFVEKSDTTF